VIATKPMYSPRAAQPEEIAAHYPTAQLAPTVVQALELAQRITSDAGLILVAGTIPLVAEALELLRGQTSEARMRLQ
jgi:folylpolyglutamate synthase/dihydropteroate synthase